MLKGRRQDLAHHHVILRAFHNKDVFHETLAWKEGNGPPALLDREGKKLPKHASLRVVVPDLVRVAKAKLPVVEVVEERLAMRRAVEPQAPPGLTELGEGKKDDLWEVVEDGSTTAPSAEEVPEPTEPEPIEQPVMEPAAEAPEPKDPAHRQGPGPCLVRQGSLGCLLFPEFWFGRKKEKSG